MLPLLVLRRTNAVLTPAKDAVPAKVKALSTIGHGQEELLKKVAGCGFYNVAVAVRHAAERRPEPRR